MVEKTKEIFSQKELDLLRLMREIDKNVLQEFAIMIAGALINEKSNTVDEIRILLEHAKKLDKDLRKKGMKQ